MQKLSLLKMETRSAAMNSMYGKKLKQNSEHNEHLRAIRFMTKKKQYVKSQAMSTAKSQPCYDSYYNNHFYYYLNRYQ